VIDAIGFGSLLRPWGLGTDYPRFRALAVSEPGVMNAREYDLLTAAPSRQGERSELPAPGAGSVGVRRVHQLRAIARAPALVRRLCVAIVALPRTGPRRYDAAMFTTLAAMALIAAQPAILPALREPGSSPEPNPHSVLPPLGCLQMFPAHAWCVAQEEGAKAFAARCDQEIACLPECAEKERARWAGLGAEARRREALWHVLAEAQDPANARSERTRRGRLEPLYYALDDKDFYAGRMLPPIPPGAPRD
jgi:hypothetical protein